VRTREILEQEICTFSVVEIDGTIAGCGALVSVSESQSEIACVAVHPEFQKRGFATKLLSALENKAQQQGQIGVFVLSTQTAHWFVERGYQESNAEQLPDKRKTLYSNERNSKVLYKALSG